MKVALETRHALLLQKDQEIKVALETRHALLLKKDQERTRRPDMLQMDMELKDALARSDFEHKQALLRKDLEIHSAKMETAAVTSKVSGELH